MNGPLVSVIIPVYNAEKTLLRCLDGIGVQTLRDVEVICVDDGSSDGSGEMLDAVARQDARYRVFHRENAGPAAARNFALESARGEYLMFCDADDTYRPEMCERMVATIRLERTDFVTCRTAFRVEGDVSDRERAARCDEAYFNPPISGRRDLTDQDVLATNGVVWNKIFERDKIIRSGIRFPDSREAEDVAFCLQCFLLARSAVYLPEALYEHTIAPEGLTAAGFRRTPVDRFGTLKAAKAVMDFAVRNGCAGQKRTVLQEMAAGLYRTARGYFPPEERRELIRSFNAVLAAIPPPRGRIVDLNGKLLLVGAGGR